MFVHGTATGFLVNIVNMCPKSMLTLMLIWSSFRSSLSRGISNLLAEQDNPAARISAGQNIPTVDEAEASYVAGGGHLSPMVHFGSNPLADSPELIQQHRREMQQNIPTPE